MNHPHDIIPTIEPRRMVYQTQARPDHVKLEKLCPKDQKVLYVASWNADCSALEFTETSLPDLQGRELNPVEDALAKEIARLKPMRRKDLETLAAERGVKWDKGASNETMAQRVAEAGLPKDAAPVTPVTAVEGQASA